jgi:outer membrane protein
MNHFHRAAAIGLFFACAAAAQAKPASPPPPPLKDPGKLAVINFQGAIAATAEGKQLLAAVQKQFAPDRARLTKYGQEIAADQKQLSNGASTMSDEAKSALTEKIQREQRDAQQLQQDAQSDVQAAVSNVVSTVGNKMAPLIRAYAAAHGFAVVVDTSVGWPRNPVLYAVPNIDITQSIVAAYNAKYPAAAPAATAGH